MVVIDDLILQEKAGGGRSKSNEANPFFDQIDKSTDFRPRKKSIALIPDLVLRVSNHNKLIT